MPQSMEFWSAHLAAIAAEGISIKAYADRMSLSAASLYNWRKRLKAQTDDGAQPELQSRRFVAVRVSEPVSAGVCTLVIAPGVRLELAQPPSPAWLAAFSAALQRAG